MSTNIELNPEPALGAVFLEQLRAVGIAMRRELIALGVTLLGLGLFFTWVSVALGEKNDFPMQPDHISALVIVAVAVPLAVWKSENPGRRTYLWSLPISRRSGHISKLVGGWIWTMFAVALIPLWWWVMASVTDSLIWERGISIERNDLASGSSLEVVGGIAHYFYQLPGWLLVVPFGLATVLYLVGSALVLSTNHPFRWAVGIWFLGFALGGLNELGQAAELRALREREPERELVLEELLDEDRFLERLLGNHAPYGLTNLMDPEIARPEVIPGTTGPRDIKRADLSHWLTSMALWGSLALLAAYAAAARHREP